MSVSNMISGTFKTPASGDIYICIGFLPDWVRVYSNSSANEEIGYFSVHHTRSLNMEAGITIDDDGAITPDTYQTGIQIYRGGDIITASTTPSTSTCYVRDPDPDKRDAGTGETIDTWTLDNSSNRTGHWNDVCSTTYVGMGSRINIDGLWYSITALTSNGEDTDEVTLGEAAPSGTIYALHGMYDYIAISANKPAPPGFWIDSDSNLLNATSEIAFFEAGCYR